ncbi:unnamed protein product [Staurois parvus]|uniref:Uncharacterized protein n=1 Tax=Staurois parvus TaxID=386267 RepID=A0ABN9GQM9_9NEOB|nr:unnamed protein product [Staurois parvus]
MTGWHTPGLETSTHLLALVSGNYGGGECVPRAVFLSRLGTQGQICHSQWELSDCSIVEQNESKGRRVCCALCLPLECSTRLCE